MSLDNVMLNLALGLLVVGLTFAFGFALEHLLRVRIRSVRSKYISHYHFPIGVFKSLKRKYPHLDDVDCQLVILALRQFFLAHLKSNRNYVSMPSQAVDEVWHDFILDTTEYEKFCLGAFGRFMHHSPAESKNAANERNDGLWRCWWHTCGLEGIDPRKPTHLPLLFAIDAKLGISDGFTYDPGIMATWDKKQRLDGNADSNRSDNAGGCGGYGVGSASPGSSGNGVTSDGSGCGGGCGGD